MSNKVLRKKQMKRWLFGSRPEGQILGIVSLAFLVFGFISFFIGVSAVFREPASEAGGAAFVVVGGILIIVGATGRIPVSRAAGTAGAQQSTEPQFSAEAMATILELARTKDREFFDSVVEVARFDAAESAELIALIDDSRAQFDTELALESEWFGELSQEDWESRRLSGQAGLESLFKDQVISLPLRGRPHLVAATFRFAGETYALEIKSNWSDAISGMVMTRLERILSNPAIKAAVVLVPSDSYKRATRAVTDDRIVVIAENSIEHIPQILHERFSSVEEAFPGVVYAATAEIFPSVEDSLPSRRSARLAG